MNLIDHKKDWKRVRLDDVLKKREENDRVNARSRFDTFVKVEHMEAERLHLIGVGSQKDEELPPTFYKIFRKGQILFPTRNPHLRRTALAHCDGICGEKTLTLEVNEGVADSNLIPFLFHSASFYDHTAGAIIGSTNPHCRWRDVANYEFLLPPRDQQARLTELLWISDEVIQKEIETARKTESVLRAEIESEIHGLRVNGRTVNEVLAEISDQTPLISLKDCGKIYKGKGIPKSAVVEHGVPCIRYGELYTHHSRIIRRYNSFIEEATIPSAFKLEMNDVLFAGSGETITEIGKSAAFVTDDDAYAGSDILVFRPHAMDGRFLGYLMNSQIVRQQLNKYGTGATVMHIYKSDLEKIQIPKIPFETQVEIGRKLENYTQVLFQAEERIGHATSLQKALINQIF